MGPKKERRHLTRVIRPATPPSDQEENTLSGCFEIDFTELCRERDFPYVPTVVVRQKPLKQEEEEHSATRLLAGRPSDINIRKDNKETVRRKLIAESPRESTMSRVHPRASLTREETVDTRSALTTTPDLGQRHTLQCLYPSIQVELESPDKPETVSAINIRGWKVDLSFLEVFAKCWPVMENLHSICFWRAGLTKPALEYFVNFLPQCQHLKELCVDNNTIPEQCFHIIIEGNSVQHLSLRHCSIDNEGAKQIGLAIAGVKEPRKPKLISLNLTGNYIGDEGVAYIASALRHNRTLLSLSLGNNKIGDAGACGLAGILCPSPLSHEEMVEHRRKLLSIVEALLAEALLASHEPTGLTSPRRHSPVPVSPREGKRKLSKEATDIKGKGAKEKGADKTSAKGKRVGKADSKKDIVKGKDNTTSVTPVNKKAQRKENVSALMPLSSECCIKDDHVICPGNRVLINLNLARNQIGEDGLTALLAALRHQEDVTQAGWKEGRGLLRLCVDKNQVSLDSNLLREIKEIMNSRDPCGGPVRPTSAE